MCVATKLTCSRTIPSNLKSISLCIALAILASEGVAAAETGYPTKAVRMLVGFTPGGASDILARIVGKKLSDAWKQQVVVDNRPGGGSLIAAELTAKAAPDGYTLLCATSSLVIQPSMIKKMPFDTVRDLAPITLAVIGPYILSSNPSVEIKSIKDLITMAKAHPGKLNYASAGPGSGLHLAGALFKSMAGIDIVDVPYKGPVGLPDVLAGHIEMAFSGLPQALPHIKSGKLRPLGVTTPKRSVIAPDIPTIAESGVPGYDVSVLYGFLAPGPTPKPLVAKIHDAIVDTLRLDDARQTLLNLGLEPVASKSDEYAAIIRTDIKKWGEVVKRAGLQPN